MDDLFPDIGNTEFGDFELTEFKQSKVLDTNFNTYIKRCEIELQKGNYNNAKIEIDKAINFAETYEEKVHCTKEKIRVLKGKDYFDFVESNLEKFLNDYGIDFLLERANINYIEELIENLAIDIIEKSNDLNIDEFYSCEKYIKRNVRIIKTYLSDNIEKVYYSMYEKDFKVSIIKVINSRIISKLDKENLLIKYIIYAIKNNGEYDLLISLYMNINDSGKEKIELLEKSIKKENLFNTEIKNTIVEIKLKYLKSVELFNFIKENIDFLSEKYSINDLTNKVSRNCSLDQFRKIILILLNNKLYKISESSFEEYMELLGEEESYLFIKENIGKIILRYSANILLKIVKTNFSDYRKAELIKQIFDIGSSKEILKYNMFTYKDIEDNIEFLDNTHIYQYLNVNANYISNIIIIKNKNLFPENNGLIDNYYERIKRVNDSSIDFNIINFSKLIYKLFYDKNIDKKDIENLILKYIYINLDNIKLVYYMSIYFEINGYYRLSYREKIYELDKFKKNNIKCTNDRLEEIFL